MEDASREKECSAGVMHRDQHFEMNRRMLFSKAVLYEVKWVRHPSLFYTFFSWCLRSSSSNSTLWLHGEMVSGSLYSPCTIRTFSLCVHCTPIKTNGKGQRPNIKVFNSPVLSVEFYYKLASTGVLNSMLSEGVDLAHEFGLIDGYTRAA